MKELLISILETFCPDNVYLQGTMNPDEPYPKKFITFFTTTTDDINFYSNDVNAIEWEFAVMFYSTDPTEVNTIPAQISVALKTAGFIPQGKGNDILSDDPLHTGWAQDFLYRENINE
jgi:hypothetical protein